MADTLTPFYSLQEPTPGGDSNLWGGILNTDLATLDTIIGLPRIVAYTPVIAGSTVTIDLTKGNVASYTVVGATTFAFSNVPAGTFASTVVLVLTNGGAGAITWPGSVTWIAGAAPTLRASGVNLLIFRTITNGTTWYGSEDDPTRFLAGTGVTMARPALALWSAAPGNFTSSTEASVASVTLAANTLAATGDGLIIRVRGSVSGPTSQLRIKLGSSVYVANNGGTNNLTTNVAFLVDCTVTRNSTNSSADSVTVSGTAITLNDFTGGVAVNVDQTLDVRAIANGGATIAVDSITAMLVRA